MLVKGWFSLPDLRKEESFGWGGNIRFPSAPSPTANVNCPSLQELEDFKKEEEGTYLSETHFGISCFPEDIHCCCWENRLVSCLKLHLEGGGEDEGKGLDKKIDSFPPTLHPETLEAFS